MIPLLPLFIFGRSSSIRREKQASAYRSYEDKNVIPSVATSTVSQIRVGSEFTIDSPRHQGKTFTVLYVAPNGFQYKTNGDSSSMGYRDFKDASDIHFKETLNLTK